MNESRLGLTPAPSGQNPRIPDDSFQSITQKEQNVLTYLLKIARGNVDGAQIIPMRARINGENVVLLTAFRSENEGLAVTPLAVLADDSIWAKLELPTGNAEKGGG